MRKHVRVWILGLLVAAGVTAGATAVAAAPSSASVNQGTIFACANGTNWENPGC
jgi:hypothetical protein